jgi:tRNA A-37 threonylcarbamoyl transferase component Bud32
VEDCWRCACWVTSGAVQPENDRLPHGYTNRTRLVGASGIVEKAFEGRDAVVRLRREAACLRRVAAVLPVPAIVDVDEQQHVLRTRWIEGTPGQSLMRSGSPRSVLTAAGSLLRRLQRDASSRLAPALEGEGAVAVHGDFGPQNLLVGAHGEVVALVDWEFAHLGDATEDLAWAEWIVRMHHAEAVEALDALFTAYGARPPWRTRHEAMVAHCERIRRRCQTEGLDDAHAMWGRRVDATARWDE